MREMRERGIMFPNPERKGDMKYQTKRALYYTFATQEIGSDNAVKAWRKISELFGVPADERNEGEARLTSSVLAELKTAEDVRLLQKCGEGFGNVFRLSSDEEEVLELKYQALLKLKQLANEQNTTPLKAIAAACRRDPAAAVLYALQIILRNEDRKELGYRILSETLSADQNSDAGIILLNSCRGNASAAFAKLAETPEMILHPEVLEELAKTHGLNPATVQGDDRRIGF